MFIVMVWLIFGDWMANESAKITFLKTYLPCQHLSLRGRPYQGVRMTISNTHWSGTFRGDYVYCRVPGTRQLSPLEVGEDNSKFVPKKLKSINMVKQKVVIGVLRHVESNFWQLFGRNAWTYLPVFNKTTCFWVKLRRLIFRNISPCTELSFQEHKYSTAYLEYKWILKVSSFFFNQLQ